MASVPSVPLSPNPPLSPPVFRNAAQGFAADDTFGSQFGAISLGGHARAPQQAQQPVPQQQAPGPRRSPALAVAEPLKQPAQAPSKPPRDDPRLFRREVPYPRELEKSRAQARSIPLPPPPPTIPPSIRPNASHRPSTPLPPQAAASAVLEKVRVDHIALRDGALVAEASDPDALESAVLLLEVEVQHQARFAGEIIFQEKTSEHTTAFWAFSCVMRWGWIRQRPPALGPDAPRSPPQNTFEAENAQHAPPFAPLSRAAATPAPLRHEGPAAEGRRARPQRDGRRAAPRGAGRNAIIGPAAPLPFFGWDAHALPFALCAGCYGFWKSQAAAKPATGTAVCPCCFARAALPVHTPPTLTPSFEHPTHSPLRIERI